MRYRNAAPYLLSILAALTFAVRPAAAEDFYKDKQIKILVSADPNTNYDSYARTVARHMGQYIPGHPTFIVQNMPGAGGLKVANFIANAAPRDGTVLAATHPVIPIIALTNPKETQFDPTKLSWIGSATRELYVGYLWHTAPAKSMEEARLKETIVGGTAVGSFAIDMAVLANEFFGTKFKILTGYKSSPEHQLAIEKGESHGSMGTVWTNIKRNGDWVREGKITVFVQYGLKKDPQLPDVPLYIDFAKNDADLQAIRFMIARLEHGKPYFAPPEVPAERLALLRRAFEATVKDPAFVKEIESQQGEINGPMTGEELATLVAQEATTPPSVVKRIEEALARYTGGK